MTAWPMNITLCAVTLVLLALMPVWILIFFRNVLYQDKKDRVLEEISTHRALDSKLLRSKGHSEQSLNERFEQQYRVGRFIWPVSLLCVVQVVAFTLCIDYTRMAFSEPTLTLPAFLLAVKLPLVGFMGVYLFNLGHWLRRLYQSDLTPYVFWNSLQRTLLVIGIAFVLVLSGKLANVSDNFFVGPEAAFFVLGFLVNPALMRLIDHAVTYFQLQGVRTPQVPLRAIHGINFWHEYRLEEEGIENVQNLATCDVLDLAIKTRYNIRTLIDWIDQAVLLHRVGLKALVLRESAFVSGAIDLAWASPENGGQKYAEQVAKLLQVEVIYAEALMNSLFQDAYVEMLWQLWQSNLEAKSEGTYMGTDRQMHMRDRLAAQH